MAPTPNVDFTVKLLEQVGDVLEAWIAFKYKHKNTNVRCCNVSGDFFDKMDALEKSVTEAGQNVRTKSD